MSEMPLVSIIIPTYNRASVLIDAINSAKNQSYRNTEIIIVDDGSSDETESLCLKHDVIYIKQNNSGASIARNAGIKQSKGDYIAFLDSDDIWHPLKLEKQIKFFSENPDFGLVHTEVEIIHHDEEYSFQARSTSRFEEFRSFESVVKNPYFGLPTVMIPKYVLDDVGLFDESLKTAEDLDLFLRIAIKYKIGYIKDTLLVVRKGSDNLSGGPDSYEDNEFVFKRFFERNREYLNSFPNLESSVFYRLNIKYAKYLLHRDNKTEARIRLKKAAKYKFSKEMTILFLKTFIPNRLHKFLKKLKWN